MRRNPLMPLADPGRRSLSLKPKKVTLFTMIFHNSENSIRDIGTFCRPLFHFIYLFIYLSENSQ